MILYTTGYEKKPASLFFETLRDHHIERLIDIRRFPDGPMEGYARRDDLAYLLQAVLGCEYIYFPLLAPTGEMLSRYQLEPNWEGYVTDYEKLMEERDIPGVLERRMFDEKRTCLLCFEASPVKCHRRLAAERLAAAWGDVEIQHI